MILATVEKQEEEKSKAHHNNSLSFDAKFMCETFSPRFTVSPLHEL